jgi:branched-chain amino acid aminotransferase
MLRSVVGLENGNSGGDEMLNRTLLPAEPKERIIYLNGEFLPQSKAVVSVLDHGLMYGDGCFDAWCGRNGFIFHHELHMERLYRSIRALKLDRLLKMTYEQMFETVIETVRRNVVTDFYIKVIVTRGKSSEPVMNMRDCKEATVIIYARPTIDELDVSRMAVQGIRIKILSTRRVSHDAIDPKVKSLNYLNIVMGKYEAWDSGYDDGVMLDANGWVAECPGFNIMAVEGDTLFTSSHELLEGITRASVIEMAQDFGMRVERGFYSAMDFAMADEVFMTSTVSGVAPVTEIDGYKIGTGKPGPRTIQFASTYRQWLESGKHGTQCFPEAWQ